MNTTSKRLPASIKGTNSRHFSEESEVIDIDSNPLTLVRQNNEWHVLFGKYRINEEPFLTAEAAKKDADRTDLNRILHLTGLMLEIRLTKNENEK